jgi:uncharacterized membrane protein
LIFTLFPKKTSIDIIERIALSLGLSIAIVPLIGLGLNYTVFGIRLQPIFFSIFGFIIIIGLIGIYRWSKILPEKRFIISINLSLPKSKNKIENTLTIVLIALIIIAGATLAYVIINPITGEKFTEFYLLGSKGNASGYPTNLSLDEIANVIIGIANHEYETINYTIEIWLVNQSTIFNKTSNENETIYHNMWFIRKINVTLNHLPVEIEQPWTFQWEYNYTFSINKSGIFKIAFFLYTNPTNNYEYLKDYKNLANEKINNIHNMVYRSLHLWVKVSP